MSNDAGLDVEAHAGDAVSGRTMPSLLQQSRHEAGHFVVHRAIFPSLHRAHVQVGTRPRARLFYPAAPTRRLAIARAAIDAAGVAAQRYHSRRAWADLFGREGWDDFQDIVALARQHDNVVRPALRLATKCVAVLWPQIDAVAAALRERNRLSGVAAAKICAAVEATSGLGVVGASRSRQCSSYFCAALVLEEVAS